MKTKNSGLTASGLSRPEIRPGDIFRDNHGSVITVTESAHNRVIYFREGYASPCVCSPDRLMREFSLVSKAPPAKNGDLERLMCVTGAERIRVIREIIRERGKSK
ncbi:DUF4222 domain-containing protein [Salmonella enterica subsp. enterica serovar Poona]|nr:DUF4222 domain-containing protein [Salmonella enterica]EHJ8935566.1 DUF4222 domain-containing protein [Salmonella enterica]EHJ8935940.1 DUF4222 domain-containing protein [Salmonella enterica]EIF7446493.1 DUF4222 domain-containing protein [Salmonella enterica]EIG0452734.1 DUF4222 domain-containing protein [Salmonella enterica]